MWGLEHISMLVSFVLLSVWLACNRRWLCLIVALLTQLPFWAGSYISIDVGNASPANLNIILNVTLAGIVVSLAEKLQKQGQESTSLIWICVLFLILTSTDVWQLIAPFNVYFIVQEVVHYLALIVVGGRAYVNGRYRINSWGSMYIRNSVKSGDLA